VDDTWPAGSRGASLQLHQAAGIGRDERVDGVGARELVVGHRRGDLGLAHREGPTEPAAKVRAQQSGDHRARAPEQATRWLGNAQLAQHVARVVVGDRAAIVRPRRLETGGIQEGGELPDLERVDLDQLRQVVREHRRARAGGNDNRSVAREGADEAAADAPRGGVVAAVEGRLTTADLSRRELDLVAG
jgi:hypothetical protein